MVFATANEIALFALETSASVWPRTQATASPRAGEQCVPACAANLPDRVLTDPLYYGKSAMLLTSITAWFLILFGAALAAAGAWLAALGGSWAYAVGCLVALGSGARSQGAGSARRPVGSHRPVAAGPLD